ncbi:MAG: flippase-like domain-containing protein [Anaerolineales bacterium]|nr:flippase-like domain-containing protein [Anaerolineales bacterium]
MGNSILPARAGEFVRAAYLSRQNSLSVSYALAVGLVERLMDLIALIVLGSLALSTTGIVSPCFSKCIKRYFHFGIDWFGRHFYFALFWRINQKIDYDFPSAEGHW